MQQFAIDFYVWSDDRYVRAMTYTADLSIPVNLSTQWIRRRSERWHSCR